VKQIDISSEAVRVYTYIDDGKQRELSVGNPVTLFITDDGGHRVQNKDMWVYHIPKGWIELRWLPKVGSPAVVA
jgi:hypothetical protein